MMKTKRRKNISALQLRSLAGRAPHERGSALLIVIGTLALVAVFAAVYVSIGRTDRRAAQSFRARVEQRDNSFQFAEYLSGVIGDDRLDAYVQYRLDGSSFARREVIDLPYTDWTRRSEVNLSDPNERALLFTPTGGPYELGSLGASADFRVQSDPWLASTTPTFLGTPGDPTFDDQRPFGKIVQYDPNVPNAGSYLDQRDWLQISNFAFDGRPVNLFNLRPNTTDIPARNVNQSDVGGFDAEPGFGTSPRASDGRPIRRMSNYLSLLNVEDPSDPNTFLKAFDPVQTGTVWVPGYNTPQSIGLSGAEIQNTPAVWTMYQRYMFMPMNQPFVIYNRGSGLEESSWADPDYPPYQYADADGDGFADSRWFELRSARDSNAGDLFGSGRDDIQELFEQGDMRYFIAARAIDLSSMVNINTATDGLVEPIANYPIGSTPAEIDFRRLLTMQDAAGDYASVISAGGDVIPLSLSDAPRPYTAEADLAAARVWDAPERQSDFRREPQDYQFYQADIVSTDIREQVSNSPSMLIGRYAYTALRRAINVGGTPGNQYFGYDQERNGNVNTDPTSLTQFENSYGLGSSEPSVLNRYNQYINDSSQSALNPGLTTTDAGLFGIDDLAELLTYHGLNDPAFTSRLERVVEGRYDSFGGGSEDPIQARRMSPLLTNRDLTLDRFGHTRILSANDPRIAPSVDNQTDLSRIGEISRNAMALMALTPRKRMTPFSGFVPMSPDVTVTDVSEREALTASDALPSLPSLITDPQQLFGLYSRALAGEIEDMDSQTWTNAIDQFDTQPFSTLFYGYRGPEVALNIAAHAAVNMVDMVDNDTTPTVATVLLDENRRSDLTDTGNFPTTGPDTDNEWYRDYPGRADGLLFDAQSNVTSANQVLATNNTLDVRRQAVNVYGMEPMPIITEVSTVIVYTDAPEGLSGGDVDYRPGYRPRRRNGLVSPPPPAPEDQMDQPQVTINGDDDIVGNPDLMLEMVAFQLHNPWDVPISLGGENRAERDALTRLRDPNDQTTVDESSNQFEFDYYIDWNGYFFKLAAFERFYPSDTNSLNTRVRDAEINATSNPADAFPSDAGYLDPATYEDFVARNAVLNPGETRVFYALSDPRFGPTATPSALAGTYEMSVDTKWRNVMSDYGDLPAIYNSLGPDNDSNGIPDYDKDEDGIPDGKDFNGWTGLAQEWIQDQLTSIYAPRSPVMIHPMNPETGEYLSDTTTYPYLTAPGSIAAFTQLSGTTDRLNANEVRLWRKITTTGEEENDPSVTGTTTLRNLLHNDLLVDRIAIDSNETIAKHLNPGQNEIEGAVSFEEDYPATTEEVSAGVRNDNTGLSIVKWGSTRRRTSPDPDYNGAEYDVDGRNIGEIREWMLSTYSDPTASVITTKDEVYDRAALVIEDFRELNGQDPFDITSEPFSIAKTDYEVDLELFDLFTAESAVVTMSIAPHRKHDLDLLGWPANGATGSNGKFDVVGARWSHPDTVTTLHWGGTQATPSTNTAPTNIRPQLIFDAGTVANAPRLSDLLLTTAIGPMYAPEASLAGNQASYHREEWITYTEALAIALGYEQPSPSSNTASSIWAETWGTSTNPETRVFDDARLALDRFVPFMNAAPAENPIVFNPGVDRIRGSGVPAALGVLDRARVFAPKTQVTDPVATTPQRDLELALTRPVVGTININTAPVEVLRLLPGLTPSRAAYVDTSTGSTTTPEWWGNRLTDTEVANTTILPASSPEQLLDNPDVAAGIVAYRDRIMAAPNTGAHASAGGQNYYYSPMFTSVNDANLDSVADNFITEDPIGNPASTTITFDRRTMTGIEGLRTTPGFGSIGELLAVRLDPDHASSAAHQFAWQNLRNLTMELYGIDDVAQGIENSTTAVPQVFDASGSFEVGQTVDDYAEKLALASGVLNMVSVRSDYYAVWFVVQGYRESDVANLRPEDPLIPTLQKRYMMVVDRSNVIEPGDKPKIVLLKEVPL